MTYPYLILYLSYNTPDEPPRTRDSRQMFWGAFEATGMFHAIAFLKNTRIYKICISNFSQTATYTLNERHSWVIGETVGSFSRWVMLPFSPASVLTGSFYAATGPTTDRTQTSQKNTLSSAWQKDGLVRFPGFLLCLRSRPPSPVVDLRPKSQIKFKIVRTEVSLTDLPLPWVFSFSFFSIPFCAPSFPGGLSRSLARILLYL